MIETIIYDYLNSLTDLGVPAYMERPKSNCPDRFILIEKTGSSKSNHIKKSVIAFQSYAKTLYEAASLNEAVKTAVEGAISLSAIGSVKLNTDYNFTDTARKEYRYQAVFEITHY